MQNFLANVDKNGNVSDNTGVTWTPDQHQQQHPTATSQSEPDTTEQRLFVVTRFISLSVCCCSFMFID